MNGEVSAQQAKKIVSMLTDGGAIENVNTPLALRLIPLAEELEDFDLVNRLLEHARKVSEDELESGWVEFCLLYTSPSPRDRSLSRMPSSA